MTEAIAQYALDAITAYGEFDVFFGNDQADTGSRQFIGMGEDQYFRRGNFKTGLIKNLFVVFGIQQP